MAVMDKEISSKIRAAIKAKLVEMGAYVDEELPDYIMVMVVNKRSKAQMIEDLQLFLGKSTDQFTDWLQQQLDKLQNVHSGNGKSMSVLSGATGKPTTAESEQTIKEKQHTTQKFVVKKVSPQLATSTANPTNSKTSSNVGTCTASIPSKVSTQVVSAKPAPMSVVTVPAKALSKTNISTMNNDEDSSDFDDGDYEEDYDDGYLEEDYEDFINIKADAEAEALLKAELPVRKLQASVIITPETVKNVGSVPMEQNGSLSQVKDLQGQKKMKSCVVQQFKSVTSNTSAGLEQDITTALVPRTSTPHNSKQNLRRIVATPSSVVTVVTKRHAEIEQHSGPPKKFKIHSFMPMTGRLLQSTTEEVDRETAVKRGRSSAFRVTDRLGVQPIKGISIKDRLGTRTTNSINSAQAPTASSRLVDRLGKINTGNTEVIPSYSGSSRMGERIGSRNSSEMPNDIIDRLRSKSVQNNVLANRAKVTERLGIRKYYNEMENQVFPTKGTEHIGKRSSEATNSAVTVNKPTSDGRGSRLAQRLRELAESSGSTSLGARVAHVPPNNIRQSDTTYVNRRPTINSQIVSAASRIMASHKSGLQNNSEEKDVSVEVAVPSVVRVTPRPRLPASMQANKNLLLKAVAEAQRSVAEAAAAAGNAAVSPGGAILRRGKGQEPQAQLTADKSSLYQRDEANENLEKLEGQFFLDFENRENFAVTVSNDAEEMDVAEMEEEFTEEQADQLHVTTSSSNSEGSSRVVVATAGAAAECRDAPRSFIATEKSQQITIQLSPEGSQEGDSSSENDVMMHTPSQTDVKGKGKSEGAAYDEPMAVDEEDEAEQEEEEEEEESAMSVAAVRPTVITAIPHMDLEHPPHINPQFVVTLDGLDLSIFSNSNIDDYDNGIESSSASNQDGMKEESTGSAVSNSSVSTGRATIVHRVEPRLRLGPPTQQQEKKNTGQSTDLNVNGGSSSTAAKTMERCKFWPVCRMGDKCTYHHPTQSCRAFPACKFGDKCLYVHPNCKFDASCTRRDCPYTHASVRVATSAPQGIPRTGNIQTVCRFFPNCSNPTCKFLHPKACKYGRYCVKPGCVFQHGAVPSTDKLKWVCPFRA